MKGIGKYKELTKGWENYVMGDLLNAMIERFPDTKELTAKHVGQVLVDSDWIEKLQRYTWRSAIASGLEISYDDFKEELLHQKMYDGKIIDSWKNSRTRKVAADMTRRIKKNTRTLNQRLTELSNADDVAVIRKLYNTIKDPTRAGNKQLSGLERDWENLTDAQKASGLDVIRKLVEDDIKEVQYKEIFTSTLDKVNSFQGRRLSQDQLQRANNDIVEKNEKEAKENLSDKPEVVLVGYWSLSPTHRKHYHKGGDPCEKHAKNDDGYGKGSHVGNIPIPVKDSHMGCKCEIRLKVEPKK